MTLDELDQIPPNGFHDAKIVSIEVDYLNATARLRISLLVGWPEDPEPEREKHQEADLRVTGLCFCSIDPPDPNYRFITSGRPITVGGDPAQSNNLPLLHELLAKCPDGTWCYRFFVHDWNAFIHIAARDAELTWVGPKPNHAD